MVFDFFKERAREGLEQVENIARKTAQGKLGEALEDAGRYSAVANEQFYDGLAKSRNPFVMGLDSLFGGDMKLDATLSTLEEVLLMADIGAATTDEVMEDLRRVAKADKLDPDDVKAVLRARLVQVLEGRGGMSLGAEQAEEAPAGPGVVTARDKWQALTFAGSPQSEGDGSHHPGLTVFLVIGANGMGKTTTIGKLAKRLKTEGKQRVMLAACDTFRAAAVEQLEMWAERAEADGFVKPLKVEADEMGAAVGVGSGLAGTTKEKPSTVLYRAMDAAVAAGTDVLIVDTAGRLANNNALNDELKKMRRVVEKRLGRPPHETLLVVDAAIGRNAIEQATVWRDEVGVTGVVVTKLDGTARAGYVVGLVRDLGLPVKLVGVGETIDDLKDFDPPSFVDALLGYDEAASSQLQKRLESTLQTSREASNGNQRRSVATPKAEAQSTAKLGTAPPTEMQELVLPSDLEGADDGGFGGGASAKKKKDKKKKKKKR